MESKLLIMSIFPAHYRTGVFKFIKERFNTEIFFEKNTCDNRNPDWFERDNWIYVLEDKKGKLRYRDSLKQFHNYDLFLFYDYTCKHSIYLILKCILFKKKYLLNCDGAILKPNFFRDLIKKFLISHAASYFASGKIARDYFIYYGADKGKIYYHKFSSLYKEDILENLIPENEKFLIRRKLGVNNRKLVLAVGRFIKLKNYDVLIKAWSNVSPDYKLIIIGGGEEKENYEELINQQIVANIELIDYKSKEELLEYYRAADLFVHPTGYDVWGLVINEAMANGLPVITTNNCVAGLELIEDFKNGFLVPANDDKALSEKINTILADDELCLRMANNNLKEIHEYTIENMADAQIKIIGKMLQGDT